MTRRVATASSQPTRVESRTLDRHSLSLDARGRGSTVQPEVGVRIGVIGHRGLVGRCVVELLTSHVWLRPVRLEPPGGSAAIDVPEVVITALGRDDPAAREVLHRLVVAGHRVIDVDLRPARIAWGLEVLGPLADERGTSLVLGAGRRPAVGQLLARVAAERVGQAHAIHLAYTDRPHGRRTARPTPGERRVVAELFSQPVPVIVDGVRRDEQPAATRRLAWFPRPIGPAHVCGAHGAEVELLAARVPELREVRTYEQLPTWRAEVRQALASLSPGGRAHRSVERWLAARPALSAPAEAAAGGWGCVVEVHGQAANVRGWASGRDHVHASGVVALAVAEGLTTDPPLGVRSAGDWLPAEATLDRLADEGCLRWSVRGAGGRSGDGAGS